MGLATSSASTRSSASRSGRRSGGSGATCSRIRRAASVGVSMLRRQDLGPVPREVGQGDEPRGIRKAEHGELRAIRPDRKSTRLNSSHGYNSYAVFCLKKKKDIQEHVHITHAQTARAHELI